MGDNRQHQERLQVHEADRNGDEDTIHNGTETGIGHVKRRETGKAIKKVRVSRFKINLDPHMISKIIADETGFYNR